jgi:hypothetical protein
VPLPGNYIQIIEQEQWRTASSLTSPCPRRETVLFTACNSLHRASSHLSCAARQLYIPRWIYSERLKEALTNLNVRREPLHATNLWCLRPQTHWAELDSEADKPNHHHISGVGCYTPGGMPKDTFLRWDLYLSFCFWKLIYVHALHPIQPCTRLLDTLFPIPCLTFSLRTPATATWRTYHNPIPPPHLRRVLPS